MAKRRDIKKRKQDVRHLVLCEGQTEQWYFSTELDSKQYKVERSKYSNASQLINQAVSKMSEGWDKIYCVFDKDFKSNIEEQLQAANKTLENRADKLVRIFSNPCFEVAFLFHFENNIREFTNYKDVETQLNQSLKKHGTTYSKAPDGIEQICKLTDFDCICRNAKTIYDRLEINNNNWLSITDGFSEIFKLSLS